MKYFILFFCGFFFIQQAFGQYTQVPDPNFEQALIDLGIDSEGILDGQFLTADAENITILEVDNKNINDLTGIEAFVNLQWLDAFENNISQIDLSLITSSDFYTLRLANNNLTTIDLSPIPDLVNIGLHSNNITTIDASNLTVAFVLSLANNPLVDINLSNTHIQILEFQNVLLTTIDLSTVINLQEVYFSGSQIQSLDFSNNPILEVVQAINTPLTSINLPNNPNLKNLFVSHCLLTALDITHCPGLLDLECGDNMLSSLDVHNNELLEDLSIINNQISTIDLTNNPNIFRFWAINNLIQGDLHFGGNPILEDLWLDNNLFTSLDLSENSILEKAVISNNPNVEMVNLKNGNNVNMAAFGAFDCPNLSCVVVDDPLANNNNILFGPNTNATLVGSVAECDALSLDENELQNLLQVYPNPVVNVLHINNIENITIEKITVYDILGKIVFEEAINFNHLNIAEQKSGILFLKIETKSGTITKKIIKL